MKQILTTSQAANLLTRDENANWSYRGAIALVEYLEEIEESTGEEMEFDAVAIRCDFAEWGSLTDFACQYTGEQHLRSAMLVLGIDLDGDETDDEIDDFIRSFISDHGVLIEFNGGIIVNSF